MKKPESKTPTLAKRRKRTAPRLEKVDDRNMNVVPQDEDQLRDLLGTRTRAMANGIFTTALPALGVSGAQQFEMMASMGEEMKPREAVEAMLFLSKSQRMSR